MVTVLSHKRLTKMIQTIRLHLSYKYWYSILKKLIASALKSNTRVHCEVGFSLVV